MTIALGYNIKKNVSLKKYTTFKIGGPAKFFVEIKKLNQLADVLNWAQKYQQKIFILGGGSNLLFMDDGFAGLVIKIVNDEVNVAKQDNQIIINCGTGITLGHLVAESLKNKAIGLEWAVGIPGTVGGAIRGNAGAFGGEIKNVIKNVEVLNIKNRELISRKFLDVVIQPRELVKKVEDSCYNMTQKFTKDDCEFDYRSSIFKKYNGLLIWSAQFELDFDQNNQAVKIAKQYLEKRQKKQPKIAKFPSAGSVFKNPIVSKLIIKEFEDDLEVKARNNKVPAGWLVERCNLKGKKIGGAMISEEHGNFIINIGQATAQDVLLLISIIKTAVRNKYGIQLQEEICVVY